MTATLVAAAFGVFLGIWTVISDFPCKRLLQHVLNILMSMPTVLFGLIFYGV